MEATTKDLRLHTRTLIAATDRGEEVIITYRGKPRARLMPLVS
ncbi:type II toxin-antitoxin system Phd/YefM family antitoxin, partial [Marinobacter alexandrii]